MLKGRSSASDTPVASRTKPGNTVCRDAFVVALDCVLVRPPIPHQFSGAIEVEVAVAVWGWIEREIAPEICARLNDAVQSGAEPLAAFDLLLPEIIDNLKANIEAEKSDSELERRNTIQMGGQDHRARLNPIIMALRRRPLLAQAITFGKAMGSLQDEALIANALLSVSIKNPVTRALWMQAMVGHVSNPSRLMGAVVQLAGGTSESHVAGAGHGAIVEAMFSHAQSQIGHLAHQPGVFTDHDLACRSIDRFHRLMRAVNHTIEIERKSPWGLIVADLTARISERLERPMREISHNVTQALRRPREGNDEVDPDRVLEALNGLYLLATVRRCRDSLAVNALLDQAWAETGQALEVLVTRALDTYRADPADPVLRERIDAGIQMAQIRFNPEYADILKRARDGADRRAQTETPPKT